MRCGLRFSTGKSAVNQVWVSLTTATGPADGGEICSWMGDLQKVKAFILADIVGGRTPHFKRDGESTKWLKDMVWSVAERLGTEMCL